jgi:MoxR-like ATPase
MTASPSLPTPPPVAVGLRQPLQPLLETLEQAIFGQSPTLLLLLTALVAGGHVLLQGPPGVAKTYIARLMAKLLGLQHQRVQMTPDLLPLDLLGTQVFHPDTATFTTELGAVMTQVLLVDELNRASPKVQSALLQAMAEAEITLGKQTYPLPQPFWVLATQNPWESEGVYPLPLAQLDRFMMQLEVGYPNPAAEAGAVQATLHQPHMANRVLALPTLATEAEVLAWQADARQSVQVSHEVLAYTVAVVGSTRTSPLLDRGASPRATEAWLRAAQARAWLYQRTHVSYDDVAALAEPVLAHRLRLSLNALSDGLTLQDVLAQLIPSPLTTARGEGV